MTFIRNWFCQSHTNFTGIHLARRLKKKTESNSWWECVFYQSEPVKIDSSWVILFFLNFTHVAANESKLHRMFDLAKIECFSHYSYLLF